MSRTRPTARTSALLALGILLLTAGCASLPRPEGQASKKEWMKAVLEYRRRYAENPNDHEVKMRLLTAQMNAAEAYYEDGVALKREGMLDDAIYQFREGLAAMPNNEKIANALRTALREKEAGTFYLQALDLEKAGRSEDARKLLAQALEADPDHAGAKALQERIIAESVARSGGLALSSKKPITLRFNRTDVKAAFNFVGKAFGVNVVFDESIKAQEVTLSAEDVTFEQALDLILGTTQTFHKQVGPNTILVSQDTKAKRSQYDDLLIRTIQLNSAKAADMANLLKGMVEVRSVVVNESLNTLILRDTEDVLDLAQKVIQSNDRPPAEILLDVEILEANRNKVERLGLDYGSQLLYSWNLSPPGQMPVSTLVDSHFPDLLRRGVITLPAVAFNYFKQDVDSKTLAHPQIRALDSKEAKIHIGDRIPLPASVILNTTGQVQTTYTYTDIGVVLNVLPVINLDRTVKVKLSLEVSSLGANLGTASSPAYNIGSRKVETTMLLHDGESAILGGLIQDQERSTRAKIPILGDIPLIGRIFATNSDENRQRTDILLTITPRIVRDWSFPRKGLRDIYSGTGEKLSSKPKFAGFEEKAEGAAAPRISVGAPPPDVSPTPEATAVLPFLKSPGAGGGGGNVALSFSEPNYEVKLGRPVTVRIHGENLGSLREIPLSVAYNANYLKFASAGPASPAAAAVESETTDKHGLVRLRIVLPEGSAGGQERRELVELVLDGYTPGISYLMFLNPAFQDRDGNQVHPEAKASRILVK